MDSELNQDPFSERARFINGLVLKEKVTLEKKKHIVLDLVETN